MRVFEKYQIMPKIKFGDLEAYAEVKANGKHFYIAKEVGHWEKVDKLFFCSLCDKPQICKSNFCPNCGAYMRGEE